MWPKNTSQAQAASLRFLRSLIILHTFIQGMTSLIELSARRKARYLHNILQGQETKIHAFISIRTRSSINQVTADVSLIKLYFYCGMTASVV
jgi:hypothetical protein